MSCRSSKRKLQVSLRFLLIFTAVVAILLAMPIQRSLMQKRGRAWVESQNGRVSFAHKYDESAGEYWHDSEFPAPSWLVDVFGVDLFDSVDTVVLDNKTVVDLSPLTNFRQLRSLGIMIEIDDELDFRPLVKLKILESLPLAYSDISAERLVEIRELLDWVTVTAANHPEK